MKNKIKILLPLPEEEEGKLPPTGATYRPLLDGLSRETLQTQECT